MQLTDDDKKLIADYLTGIQENNLNDKTSLRFDYESKIILIFQVRDLEKVISYNQGIKSEYEQGDYFIKTFNKKFNKSFSLKEILNLEKDFVIKKFKIKSQL